MHILNGLYVLVFVLNCSMPLCGAAFSSKVHPAHEESSSTTSLSDSDDGAGVGRRTFRRPVIVITSPHGENVGIVARCLSQSDSDGVNMHERGYMLSDPLHPDDIVYTSQAYQSLLQTALAEHNVICHDVINLENHWNSLIQELELKARKLQRFIAIADSPAKKSQVSDFLREYASDISSDVQRQLKKKAGKKISIRTLFFNAYKTGARELKEFLLERCYAGGLDSHIIITPAMRVQWTCDSIDSFNRFYKERLEKLNKELTDSECKLKRLESSLVRAQAIEHARK